MDISLTLDKILELPDEVLRISNNYNEYNELLDRSVCTYYDTKELKTKIAEMFKRFKLLKYKYNIPIESNIRISSNYCLQEGSVPHNTTSQVERLVLNNVDSMAWGTKFYNSVCILSKTLTREESVYLVDTFFSNKSENVVADKLLICRRSLYKIKKSCLLKIWFELEALYNESVD